MSQTRSVTPVGVVAGIFFLCAAAGLTGAQSSPPGPVRTPHMAARPKGDVQPTDYFAGLNFTADQQAKIGEIRRNMKLRMDAVVNDQKSTAEQKDAMLAGLRRMENGEIFKLLTPEQQKEVRERIRLRRAAEREAKQKLQPRATRPQIP